MGLRAKVSSFVRHYGFGTAGAITAIGFLINEKLKDSKTAHAATRDHSYTHQPSVKWDYNWDRREPENMVKPSKKNAIHDENTLENELKSKTPTATRHLFLIRHGQYNMESRDDIFRTLTLLGQEQADITGKRLKELNQPYTKLLSSTMTRAKETGDIIHKHLSHLNMERDELLREGAPIPPEPPSSNWKPEAFQFFKEGARIEAAFRKHIHRADPEQTEDSYEVYVIHANVIRYFVCRALQFPPEGWLRMSLAHGSITQLVIRPSGRVHIRCLGESGHLPPDKISFS